MASSEPPVVLVVEDQPLMRLHAVAMIEDAGFETVEAWSAAEAVAILAARTDVRIVFTDIDMPGAMDGMRLAAAIRDRWPPIEIILTSGYKSPRTDELPERGLFFAKPYKDNVVLAAIRRFAAQGQRA